MQEGLIRPRDVDTCFSYVSALTSVVGWLAAWLTTDLNSLNVHLFSQMLQLTFYFHRACTNTQHDSQCTYSVTPRPVPVTIVAMKKAIRITYSECVCSLRYSACNAHVPYCPLWTASLHNIFPYYPIKGTIFGGGGH
jgi:hypothetical protein